MAVAKPISFHAAVGAPIRIGVGLVSTPLPSPLPPPLQVAYRDERPLLFQSVDVAARPSALGGAAFAPDSSEQLGPTSRYVSRAGGWPWVNFGGDWIGPDMAPQSATPWASIAANGSGEASYQVDVTTLAQHVQTAGKWMALRVAASGGQRSIAGRTASVRSAITYTYASGSVTHEATCVATSTQTTLLPSTTAEVVALPAFVEFPKPAAPVVQATLSIRVAEHFGGASNLQVWPLDPPRNTDPDTATGQGLAALGGAHDAGLLAVPGVMGVHRYADGEPESTYLVRQPTANIFSEANYDPAIWRGASDTSKWPHTTAHKWLVPQGADGRPQNVEITSSAALQAAGITPVAPGCGALTITIPDQGVAQGGAIDNLGTFGADLFLFLPESDFGRAGEIYWRYFLALEAPQDPAPSTRREYLRQGAPVWESMAGKMGIVPHHSNSYGGQRGNGGGGGGRGYLPRLMWRSTTPGVDGPDRGGVVAGWHIIDDWDNEFNPPGHRYGRAGDAGYWDTPVERFGQRGGRGAVLYAGRQYLVEGRLKVNTAADGTWQPDGVLQAWIDGRLVWSKTDFVWRTLPLHQPAYDSSKLRPARTLGIVGLRLNVFHGGQDPSGHRLRFHHSMLAYGTSRIGAVNTGAAPSPNSPPWASQVTSANTWTPIAGSQTMRAWMLANAPDINAFLGSNPINGIVSSFGSPAFDPVGAKAYHFGGGHAASSWNGVLEVDLSQLHAQPYRIAVAATPPSKYPSGYANNQFLPPGVVYPSGATDDADFTALTFHGTFLAGLTNPADVALSAPQAAPVATHQYQASNIQRMANGDVLMTSDTYPVAVANVNTGQWLLASSQRHAATLNSLGLGKYPVQSGAKSVYDSVTHKRYITITPGDAGLNSRSHIAQINADTHTIESVYPVAGLSNSYSTLCIHGRKLWIFVADRTSVTASTANSVVMFDLDTKALTYATVQGVLFTWPTDGTGGQEVAPAVSISATRIMRWNHGAEPNALYEIDTTPTSGAGTAGSPWVLQQTRRTLSGMPTSGGVRHYRLLWVPQWQHWLCHFAADAPWYALRLT